MIDEVGGPSFAAVRGIELILVASELKREAFLEKTATLTIERVATFYMEMMMHFAKTHETSDET